MTTTAPGALAPGHLTTLPDLATRSEVAAYIRMSTRYVLSETTAGRLPAVKLGRSVRYRRADVDRWLTRHLTAGAR
jgi:excisionase family DNA binding protein